MKFSGLNIGLLRQNGLLFGLLSVIAWGTISCDHKDLCFDHWDHARRYSVDYRTTWQQEWQYPSADGTDWQADWGLFDFGTTYDALRPDVPTGIKVQVYTDGHNNDVSNLPAAGGIVDMAPGEHQILFYNNNTEYILFNDLHSLAAATATTRTRTRSTYIGNSMWNDTRQENTVNPPDFLFEHYVSSYHAEKSQLPPVVPVTMKPLVFRYLVRYHFDSGLKYVALGRGALAGMAASVYLTDGHTGTEPATVLYDCEVKPWGVEAVVNTFGVPNYPNPDYSRAEASYGLNLEVMLTNGQMLNFDFDITDQIVRQPRGGVIEVRGIRIPDEIGQEGGGSFNVDVEGWGDFEDITVDFGKK